jgi:hypothetical protein
LSLLRPHPQPTAPPTRPLKSPEPRPDRPP